MTNLDSFEKECSTIFNKYLEKFKNEIRTTDNLRDKPFNLTLSHTITGQLIDEIVKISNSAVEQYSLDKENVVEVAKQYIKDFSQTTIKLS